MRIAPMLLMAPMCLAAAPAAGQFNSSLHLNAAALRVAAGNGATAASRPLTLDVSVTDASGNPITGLKRTDFSVSENGQPREIISVREVTPSASAPLVYAVLLLDALNAVSPRTFSEEVKAADKFLSNGSGPLPFPVSIVVVTESGLANSDSSQDRNKLDADLKQLAHGVHVVDCLNQDMSPSEAGGQAMDSGVMGTALDRVDNNAAGNSSECLVRHESKSIASLDKIVRQQTGSQGRFLLVWVGPGWPLLSGRTEKSFTNGDNTWFGEAVHATTELRDTQTTLNVVSQIDFERGKEYRHVDWNALNQGAANAKAASAGSILLPVLAQQSGGRAWGKSKDMAQDIAASLAAADHYYVVSYEAQPGSSHDELRGVQVKVSRSDAAVHAPSMYYAQP